MHLALPSSSSFYFLSPGGVSRASLPPIPALISCMPTINRTIPMIKPAKTAPKNGDTIIKPPKITAKIPTPMEKPRTHPLCVLSPNPCIIIAMPSNNNANPRNKNSAIVVPTG